MTGRARAREAHLATTRAASDRHLCLRTKKNKDGRTGLGPLGWTQSDIGVGGTSIYDVHIILVFFTPPPLSAKSVLFVHKFNEFLNPPPFVRTSCMEVPLEEGRSR